MKGKSMKIRKCSFCGFHDDELQEIQTGLYTSDKDGKLYCDGDPQACINRWTKDLRQLYQDNPHLKREHQILKQEAYVRAGFGTPIKKRKAA